MRKPEPPGWGAWIAVVVSTLASIGLNILITITLSDRAAQGQRESSCEIARTQLAIYEGTPPTTPTGRAAREAWRVAESRWECDQL